MQEDMTGWDPETIHTREGKMGLVCMEKKMNLERGGDQWDWSGQINKKRE